MGIIIAKHDLACKLCRNLGVSRFLQAFCHTVAPFYSTCVYLIYLSLKGYHDTSNLRISRSEFWLLQICLAEEWILKE